LQRELDDDLDRTQSLASDLERGVSKTRGPWRESGPLKDLEDRVRLSGAEIVKTLQASVATAVGVARTSADVPSAHGAALKTVGDAIAPT